jgi:processive 1,2-diacylglycerol beta-glucosyltransferase
LSVSSEHSLLKEMRSVLILTAGYGEGHNAAARGLKEGFDLLGDPRAEVIDLFAPAFGRFYQRSRGDYIDTVNNRPWLWASIYSGIDKFPFTSQMLSLLWPIKRELVRVFRETRPEAVVSVYPVYGHLMAAASREAGIPGLRSYIVVTDSITVNSVWYKCGADTFLVPNEDTATVMRKAGVHADNLFVSGFPVSTKYAAQAEARPEPGGETLPRVLYMINGQPARALALVESLLRKGGIELTVTAGKDETLKQELETLAVRMQKPLTVLGWVNHMPQLLRRNHLLIGKAGGAAVQEALAAKTPMLITQILPGQEEGNARLLLQNGCGAHCPTNEAILQSVAGLFAKGAQGWHQMHRHTCALSRPDAALATARWITQQLKNGKTDGHAQAGLRGDRA